MCGYSRRNLATWNATLYTASVQLLSPLWARSRIASFCSSLLKTG